MGALKNILAETTLDAHFRNLARCALELITNKLGWEETHDESPQTKLLRPKVLSAIGHYGDHNTIVEAKNRWRDHASDARPADPNLRGAIYSIAATNGDKEMFNTVMKMYQKETFQEEKVRLLQTLGRFTDPNLISTTLTYAFSSGEVRHGDFIYAISSLGSHAYGRRAAWQFLTENWDTLEKRYSSSGMLAHIISTVCSGFARTQDAEAIEKFFKDHPAPDATRVIAESIEYICARADWYERDKNDIAEALKPYFVS